jgi:hypothetical protein
MFPTKVFYEYFPRADTGDCQPHVRASRGHSQAASGDVATRCQNAERVRHVTHSPNIYARAARALDCDRGADGRHDAGSPLTAARADTATNAAIQLPRYSTEPGRCGSHRNEGGDRRTADQGPARGAENRARPGL